MESHNSDPPSISRSMQGIRENYNHMSRWYDIFGVFEQKYRKLGIKELDPHLGDHILEIGCGTGSALISIAKYVGETGKVVGIDIAEKMIEQARVKIKKSNLDHIITLQNRNILEFSFESAQWDGIFMSFTLELFTYPQIHQLLTKCVQILKKEGRLVIVALSKKGTHTRFIRWYEKLHEKHPKAIDCRPIDLTELILQNSLHIYKSILKEMWGLGVEIVRVHHLS